MKKVISRLVSHFVCDYCRKVTEGVVESMVKSYDKVNFEDFEKALTALIEMYSGVL